jgi:ribonuclease HI
MGPFAQTYGPDAVPADHLLTLPEDVLVVFGDGSCSNVDKRGGWAAISMRAGVPFEFRIGGQAEDTTSNRAEVMAAMIGLGQAPWSKKVHCQNCGLREDLPWPEALNGNETFAKLCGKTVCDGLPKKAMARRWDREIWYATDSQYTMKGINDWMLGWKMSDWKTADQKDVANADLWKGMLALRNLALFDALYVGEAASIYILWCHHLANYARMVAKTDVLPVVGVVLSLKEAVGVFPKTQAKGHYGFDAQLPKFIRDMFQ